MMKLRIFTILFSVSALWSHAGDPLPVSKEYWKSDAFRKSFNGSYRINARVEPFVDTKERGLLVEVQELMAKSQRTNALNKLKQNALIKTSAAIMFNAANLAYESGDLKYAESQYLAAVKVFPTFLRAQQNLAVIYAQNNEYDKAFPYLLETVKLGSQDGVVMGLLGYCHQQKDNYTSALQAFKQAQLTDSDNLEWVRGEAFCHDRLGQTEKALNLYESIIKVRPDDVELALLLANLYQRTGRYDDAIVQLELLRRKGTLESEDKVLLAQLYMLNGAETLGVVALEEALKSDDLKDADVALGVIQFLLQREDIENAKKFYAMIKTEIVQEDKAKHWYKRLGAWMVLKEEPSEENKESKLAAVTSLEELVKLDPLDADSLYLLALQAMLSEEDEKALLLLGQSAKGKGVFKQHSVLEKGKLLVGMKRYKDALVPLKEFAKQDKSGQTVEYIKAIEALVEASY